MITQLQKLWILHYIPTHYSSVLFRSLHYYRPGLIILTRKQDIVVANVFLTSTTVVLNHFTDGNQIQTYDFVRKQARSQRDWAMGAIARPNFKSCVKNFRLIKPLMSKLKTYFSENQRNCLRNLSYFSF